MDHGDFQIAVERRRRGAIDAEEARALETHLIACGTCRAYAGAAEQADAALAAAGAAVLAGADWERLEASVRRQLRSGPRRVAFDLASALLMLPLLLAGLVPAGRRDQALPAVLVACGAVVVVRAGYHRWLARRTAVLAGEELVAFHRAALRADLRRAALGRWPALGAVLAFTTWSLWPGVAPLARVALAAAALLVAGTWGYVLLARVPRLRRQLASLGPERG